MTRAVVGIIGAGQLARMTAQAAISLAVDVKVLARSYTEPACMAASFVELGDPGDLSAVRRLAQGCDVITLDHERVPLAVLVELEAEGIRVHPGSAVVQFADKAHQRASLTALGYDVPPFAVVTVASEIAGFASEHGWPVVVKTATGGYDGCGVFVVENIDDAISLVGRLGGDRLVVEPKLDITAEVAVVVARRPSGEAEVYPTVETIQQDGICVETRTPAALDPALSVEAAEIAHAIAESIGAVGVLAVEFFATPTGLVVNELAPRPHNSGHWTIEGAVTSQFENHLRGILDWPLGDVSLVAPAVATVNVLGVHATERLDLPAALDVRGAHVHLYAKSPRSGRKLGHITAVGSGRDEVLLRARTALAALTGRANLNAVEGNVQ